MKALVQEVVGNFQNRLGDFGVTVRELTGDMQLTKQQISETQVTIRHHTTPLTLSVIEHELSHACVMSDFVVVFSDYCDNA